MASTLTITGATEIRITRAELILVLGERYDALWYRARQLANCGRCGGGRRDGEPSRIYINGHGEFVLYHPCHDCGHPVRHCVDLRRDPHLRTAIYQLWQTKFN